MLLEQVVINLMEHIPSMPVLLLGRLLGGLSTSLLFTAFESWMVSSFACCRCWTDSDIFLLLTG
jgi:hypothetical protein